MPIYRLNREDAILSFALGFVGAVAFYSALNTLYKFRKATKVTIEEKQQGMIGQHTEDAITVETLGQLYESQSWDIRGASLKILIERAIHGSNLDLLLHNAASKDTEVREQAFCTLAFLSALSTSRMSLRIPKFYRIIVNTLVSYLPESANRPHEPHTDWRLRSKTEQYAITVLRDMLLMSSHGIIMKLVEAGLISRWLGQYPFCGKKAKELDAVALARARKKVLDDIASGQTDDRDLEIILHELSSDRKAWFHLRKYDLVGSYYGDDDPWRVPAGRHDVSVSTRRVGSSTGDQDQAEIARRRRRRQAFFIGDADQPISQDNIFNADSQTEYEGFSRVE